MIAFVTFLAIVVSSARSNPFHLRRDVILPTKTLDKGGKSFNSIGLYFTKSSTTILDFDINLNSNDIVIADKNSFDWGIECNASSDCEFTSTDIKEAFSYNVLYTYKGAKAYIRPSDDGLETADQIEPMAIQLMNKSDMWTTPNWGSIGFGPQGEFANYIRKLYDENFMVLLYFYRSKDHDSHYDYINYTVLEPTIEKKSYIDKIKLPQSEAYWNIKTNISVGDKTIAQDASTCLTNYGNNVLYLINADQLCQDIQKVICDGKYGHECTKDNADFSKAPELHITIQGKDYPITYKQYIKPTTDSSVICRFGQVFELRGAMNCAPEAELGLGKGFFEVYVPIFEFKTDGSSAVILLKDYVMPQATDITVWLLIVGLAAVFATGILIYMLFFRKPSNNDDEVYYTGS